MPKIIANKNVELWTESFGSSDRECILLIAGAQAPSTFWPDLFCKELARLSYFVIRYDHRDIGYSTHFPVAKSDAVKHSGDVLAGPYDIFVLVDDALAILDGYGIKKAHVVGHSMGGFIAELLILRHADRIHSATIMSAGPLSMHERHKLPAASQKTMDVLSSNKPTGDFANDLPGWLNSWQYLNGGLPFDKEMAVKYAESIYERHPGGYAIAHNHIAAVNSVPTIEAEEFKAISVPTLIVHGENDKLQLKAHAEQLAKLIPHARLNIISKAGHVFFNKDVWQDKILRMVLARVV